MTEDRNTRRRNRVVDLVLDCVIPYIHNPKDGDAVSQVCRRWYELASLTRKHVTIALCYTTTLGTTPRRFPHLESLKLKRKCELRRKPGTKTASQGGNKHLSH